MTVEACPTCANVAGHYRGCPADPERSVPPVDYAHNGPAAAARLLKAAFLMDELKARGLTPDDARRLRQKERREVERAAKVRRGSDETWELAATLLGRDAAPAPKPRPPDTALERVRAYVEARTGMRGLDEDEIHGVHVDPDADLPLYLTLTDLRELIRLADREDTTP